MSEIYMTTEIQVRPIDELRPYENNARIHSEEQIEELRQSILQFGFLRPLLIQADGGVLCGRGCLEPGAGPLLPGDAGRRQGVRFEP